MAVARAHTVELGFVALHVILLDTNALIWSLEGDDRLGTVSRERLLNAGVVYFSAISAVEMNMKAMLGRLRVPSDLADAAEEQRFTELPLRIDHAAALVDFPTLIAHDPFDRMIVAQAAVDHLTLMTSNRVLLGLGCDFIVDARA